MGMVVASSASPMEQIALQNRHRIHAPVPHFHPVASSRRLVSCNLIRGNSSGKLLLNNSSTGRQALYQPFRPPPRSLESSLSIDEQLEIVRERRGLWYEFGKYIPVLMRSGYTPASLDEATGLTGVEQNQIIVASQVRDTLRSLGMAEESLAFFDDGASVLYELRILSAQQRKIAADYVIQKNMDAKSARDVARALKDFDRRKREFGWDFFSSCPGDCLAFWWYRQSKEFKHDDEKQEALKKALEFATTETARSVVRSFMGKNEDPKEETPEKKAYEELQGSAVTLTRVVKLVLGETSGLVMLPVADPEASSIREAPSGSALGEGAFRIHRSEVGWKAWVPLPGWKPILEAVAPITVLFSDRRALGLQASGGDEQVLLVVDKGEVTSADERGMVFLVDSGVGGLSLQTRKEIGSAGGGGEVLGQVLLALSSPDSDDQGDF